MTKGLITLDEYKTYRDKLNNLIRTRKLSYYYDFCNKKQDKFQSYVGSF